MKTLIEKAVEKAILGEEETAASLDAHPMLGRMVLVRARIAGVHIGTLQHSGDFVLLTNSRRIWQWEGAFTCSELATAGPTGGRIACEVPVMTIPISDIGEIIALSTPAAAKMAEINEE